MLSSEEEISVLNILIEAKEADISRLKSENAKLREELGKWRGKLCDAQARIRKLNWTLTKTIEESHVS